MANKTLFDQINEIIKEKPSERALVFEHKKYNYKELGEKIEEAARRLSALGIKKRDVVTVLLPNCPDSVFIFYGLSAIGAIAYNVHPLTPAITLKGMVEKVNSKYVICLLNVAGSHRKEISSDVKVIGINPYARINFFKAMIMNFMGRDSKDVIKYWRIKENKTFDQYIQEQEFEDAVYLNTGGTNGEPKVVRISNEAVNTISKNASEIIGDKIENAKMLTAVPLFHVLGLGIGLHTPLSLGASACLLMKFKTKEAISQMKRGNATIVLGVPALFNALLVKDAFYGPYLKNQIAAYIGGDRAPKSLIDRWNDAMKKYGSESRLYEGYGLTETSSACNVNRMGNKNKEGSVGLPILGVKNKIIDAETGVECPPNVPGEILVGGPSVMNGYFGDESLTNETIFTDDEGVRWLHTKDFGYIDEDGFLFFKQRMRRIVKINGETLCPTDVERVVNSLPGIYDSYCYGVPNERKGHVFRLVAVIKRGPHQWSEEEAKTQIENIIHSSLTPMYLPDKIVFLRRLPRTSLGKVDPIKLENLEPEN